MGTPSWYNRKKEKHERRNMKENGREPRIGCDAKECWGMGIGKEAGSLLVGMDGRSGRGMMWPGLKSVSELQKAAGIGTAERGPLLEDSRPARLSLAKLSKPVWFTGNTNSRKRLPVSCLPLCLSPYSSPLYTSSPKDYHRLYMKAYYICKVRGGGAQSKLHKGTGRNGIYISNRQIYFYRA